MNLLSIDPTSIAPRDFYQYLIGAVSPRPIALVSTLDKEGVPNLAPFSFFNAFSGTPPIVGFSVALKGGERSEKDTLYNVMATGELVINTVSHNIARQMALSSVEFPPKTNEFIKAGLTALPSERVAPFRVQESLVQMECTVEQIVPLLEKGRGAHLVLCRIVLMHLSPSILNEKGRIDLQKVDLIGRMGRQYYVRAAGEAIFEMPQDTKPEVVGFDGLPVGIRESKVLTGNQLAQLAALPALPQSTEVQHWMETHPEIRPLISDEHRLHLRIAEHLDKGNIQEAALLTQLLK